MITRLRIECKPKSRGRPAQGGLLANTIWQGAENRKSQHCFCNFFPTRTLDECVFKGTEETLVAIEMFLKGSIKSVVCRHSAVRKGD